MNFSEFRARFTAELIRMNEGELDLDGDSIVPHATRAAEGYFTDPAYWSGSNIDPEACARAEHKNEWEFS